NWLSDCVNGLVTSISYHVLAYTSPSAATFCNCSLSSSFLSLSSSSSASFSISPDTSKSPFSTISFTATLPTPFFTNILSISPFLEATKCLFGKSSIRFSCCFSISSICYVVPFLLIYFQFRHFWKQLNVCLVNLQYAFPAVFQLHQYGRLSLFYEYQCTLIQASHVKHVVELNQYPVY